MKKILSVVLALLTVAMMFTAVSAAEQTRDPALPEGYKQVEYLESNDKQMIDTGIFPNKGIKAEIKFQFTDTSKGGYSGTAAVFGSNKGGNTANCTINVGYKPAAANATFRVGPDASSSNKSNVNTSINKDTDVHVVEVDCTGNCSMKMDGQAIITGQKAFVDTAEAPNISIFATRYGKSTDSPATCKAATCYAKVYYAKIWSGATLVRDYIPAVNSVGSAGLYDKVSNTFFMNVRNSEDFQVGPEVKAADVTTAAPTTTSAPTTTGSAPSTTAPTTTAPANPDTGDRMPLAIVGVAVAALAVTFTLVIKKKENEE